MPKKIKIQKYSKNLKKLHTFQYIKKLCSKLLSDPKGASMVLDAGET